MPLCIASQLHALGYEDALSPLLSLKSFDPTKIASVSMRKEHYSQTARCITQAAEIICIKLQDFVRSLQNATVDTWNELLEIIKIKTSQN
jgi:hypothetical protein